MAPATKQGAIPKQPFEARTEYLIAESVATAFEVLFPTIARHLGAPSQWEMRA
jgi:hypothetical protein